MLLDRYAIDELKLIGLVTRTDTPRAMLVDPSGKGWVVTKGQFIGRAEVVHAGGPGGVDYELNWRVDRIREGDLVLVREDPAHTDVPPATRVIALRAPKRREAVTNSPSTFRHGRQAAKAAKIARSGWRCHCHVGDGDAIASAPALGGSTNWQSWRLARPAEARQ